MQNNKGIAGEFVLDRNNQLTTWQELQFGMFIHLGIYSQLGGVWNGEPIKRGYSEQIQMWANISRDDYAEVASQLTLENFDPQAICSLAKESGMKYIVITSKHHDGFCMFDTKTTDYNVVKSTPFAQDVLKLLSEECRKQGLKFGVYFSLVDWYQGHKFDWNNNNEIPKSMEPIIEEQLQELMTNYGSIAEVWFDMSSPTAEQSAKFANIVHQFQPEAAVNGRIWNNQGDFRTLDDNQIPLINLDGAWQTPASIYHETWGYRSWQQRDDVSGKVRDLLKSLISIRSRGGNYLLNIGPRGDGSVVEFEAEVLQEIGKWIMRHPDALLGTNPTGFKRQSWGEVTANGENLFLHVTEWPKNGKITIPGVMTTVKNVVEDGFNRALNWNKKDLNLEITLPKIPKDELLTTIRVELANELYIVPNTITIDSDNIWKIKLSDIEKSYNFADDGNYTSLVQTNIRQSAYLSNHQDGKAFVQVYGKANPELNYAINLGTEIEVVKGKDLMDGMVGPFILNSEVEILPFNIKLYKPIHRNKDLELDVESIVIKLVEAK